MSRDSIGIIAFRLGPDFFCAFFTNQRFFLRKDTAFLSADVRRIFSVSSVCSVDKFLFMSQLEVISLLVAAPHATAES